MLNLLAEQDDELTRLNSAIDNLSERVDIHCEKVARREVGALTARKPISKAPTIITPGKEFSLQNLYLAFKLSVTAFSSVPETALT